MTRQNRPWFAHPVVFSLVLFCTGALSVSLIWRIIRIVRQNDSPNLYQEPTQKLEKEVEELRHKLDQQNQPFYQESIIRDQLNMQKPDEVILQLPSTSSATTQ